MAEAGMAGAEPAASGRPGWRGPWRGSIRHRLLAIALLPTLVILPALLGVTMVRWSAKFDDLLITKVNSDLTVARQYLTRILETNGDQIAALGQSVAFATAPDLPALLDRRRREMGLDFLLLVPPGPGGGPLADTAEVRLAAAGQVAAGQAATGIGIMAGADLARLSPDLAERARLALVPTPNAQPTRRSAEDRGMLIVSAVLVAARSGAGMDAGMDGGTAVLAGGVLLNRNLGFIDTINDLVYRAGSLPEGSEGTATLFLDDVRISTDVRLFEDRRALGTRVSAEVRRKVLEGGETWLDRAFVVNDWYISAYEPIRDRAGSPIGMLYVGFLEAPFAAAKRATIWLVLLGFAGVTAVSIPVFLRWAQGVFRPLEKVTDTIAQVEAGRMEARTGVTDRGDEVGRVASHLDHLLDLLQQRDRELRRWNDELNARVEDTTRKLLLSEKLATIGEITASAAHEINNPVAVIQGNLDLLRDILADAGVTAETELRLMDEQVQRISRIVDRLLQFARPEEYAGWTARTDPRDALSDCLPLVRHMLTRAGAVLRADGRSSRQVLMNRVELQQVLVNLIVNAINAMPAGGEVLVVSRNADREGAPGVEIAVEDQGTGMAPEVLDRIFEPFYTTRGQAGGTGLGLSVCRTLVERQGGMISAASRPGQGSRFALWLPEAR
ncbi:sensor histidine kinase [Frigidibacter oleivorans]|uniref:sensor histidine kinase n=1 Tax=Frigidibacter oleivorans TaxID=2487129 RepID=UPI001F159BE1|nr:cache domain-containing protein [Frigidibacter oleivorans]